MPHDELLGAIFANRAVFHDVGECGVIQGLEIGERSQCVRILLAHITMPTGNGFRESRLRTPKAENAMVNFYRRRHWSAKQERESSRWGLRTRVPLPALR